MKLLGYFFGIAIACLVFEIMAQVLFFSREGVLLSQHDPAAQIREENRLNAFDQHVGLPGVRLHPLFGWANAPTTPGYNNQGFLSDRDFPHTASGDDFVVGVFGGSLASNFWAHNSENGVFQTSLRKALPELGERPIVLLNFAKEAYRQPQQLGVLNYFAVSGQRFDLVLNIEGYNEITGGWVNTINGVEVSMPVSSLLFEFSRLTGSDSLGAAAATNLTARNIEARAHDQRLASAWLVLLGLSKIVELTGNTQTSSPGSNYDSRSNLLFIAQASASTDRAAFVEHLSGYWRRATVQTARSADAAGARYLQVLQPNQYVRTARVFSPEERAVAFAERNAYDGLIDEAYQRLRREIPTLPQDVRVIDASASLDAIGEPVYADNCCHLNDRGRDAFTAFVAAAVAEYLSGAR